MADPAPIPFPNKGKSSTQSSAESNNWSVATSVAPPRNVVSRERSVTPSPAALARQSHSTSEWGAAAEAAPIAVRAPVIITKEDKPPEPGQGGVERAYPETHPLNPKHPFYAKATDPNRTHRQWDRKEGYVIKCDVCEERAPGVLYQCKFKSCNERVCITCARNWVHIQDGKKDTQHYIDPEEHNWDPPQKKKPAPKPRGSRKRGNQGVRNAPTPEVRKRPNEDDDVQEIPPPKKRIRNPRCLDERKPVPEAAPEANMAEDLTILHDTGFQDAEEIRRRRIRAAAAAAAAAPNNVELITDDDSDDSSNNQGKGKQPERNLDFGRRGSREPARGHTEVHSDHRGNQRHDQGLHPDYVDYQHRADHYQGRREGSTSHHDREDVRQVHSRNDFTRTHDEDLTRGSPRNHIDYHDRRSSESTDRPNHAGGYQDHQYNQGPRADHNRRLDENSLTTRQRIVMHFFRQIFQVNLRHMPRSFQRPITTISEVWNVRQPHPQNHDIYDRQDYQGRPNFPTSSERAAPQPHQNHYRSTAEINAEEVHRRITNAWAANGDLCDERRQWDDMRALQLLWEVFEVRRDTMSSVAMDQTVHWFISERNRVRAYQDDATLRKLQPYAFPPSPPPPPPPPPRPTPPRNMREGTTPAPPARRSVSVAPRLSPVSEDEAKVKDATGSESDAQEDQE